MKETHVYQSKPEPGFEERLFQQVGSYFVQIPKTELVVFRTGQVLRDYPDLKDNPEFIRRIEEAARIQYDHFFSFKI